MSATGGRASGVREIPPAPATYRLRGKEPTGHQFHLYMPLRDLEHAAADLCPSLVTVAVLMAYALRTNADGTTRASVREVALHLSRSPGTVHRHVKRLVELGFLEQLVDCREGNRHASWRVAGMDRSDKVAAGPGEKQHRGGTSARAGGARHPATARAGGARLPAVLPGELIEPTRASPQQEPLSPRDWGRANDPVGIRAAREALRARGAPGGAPGAPGAPAAGSDGSTVLAPGTEAQEGTERAAEGAA